MTQPHTFSSVYEYFWVLCKIRDFAVKCHYKKPFIWIVVKSPPADFQWGFTRASEIAKRESTLKTYGLYFGLAKEAH